MKTLSAPTPAPLVIELRLPQDQLEWLRDQLAGAVPANNNGKPLTAAQAAERLGVSEDTVRRRIKAGTIKCVPNVGRTLVPMSEINRLLSNPQPGGDAS